MPSGVSKEKVKEYHKRYYEKHKEKILEKVKKYNEENKEKRAEYQKEYHKQHYLDNKDKIDEYHRNLYHSRKEYESERKKKYYQENKEKVKERQKKYREENPEKWKETQSNYVKNNPEKNVTRRNRRKSKEKELEATFTSEQWEFCKRYFKNKCCYCGKKRKLEQEHLIPIDKNGGYVMDNIVPSCGSCNRSKAVRDFSEWYKTQEFYSTEREQKILEYIELVKDKEDICQL